MEVTFYQLKKRPNSTKTISKTECEWFTVDVELKEPCSTDAPVFTLQLSPRSTGFSKWPTNVIEMGSAVTADITSYTHVDMTNLYFRCPVYRITHIEFDNTTATVNLAPDLLASYRTEILESNQFVSRISDKLKSNRTQIDTLPLAENRYRYSYSAHGTPVFKTGFDDGSYVIGVINNRATVGSVCYYVFNSVSQFEDLMSYLMGEEILTSISDVSAELLRGLLNPVQYIVSCKYFPLKLDLYEANGVPITEKVRVGYWDTPVYAYKMVDYSTNIFGTVPRSMHPQAETESDYLMLAPYSEHCFFMEPFGAIPIDAGILCGADVRLAFRVTVDHISGKGRLYLYRDTSMNDFVGVYYADIAQDIRVSQFTRDLLGAAESGFSAAGNIANSIATRNIGAALASGAQFVADSFQSMMPQIRTSSGGAYTAFIDGSAKLFSRFIYIDDNFNDEYGYVCNMIRGLNSCIGDWVQCPHPRLELIATKENVQNIYEFLKEGVYLE